LVGIGWFPLYWEQATLQLILRELVAPFGYLR